MRRNWNDISVIVFAADGPHWRKQEEGEMTNISRRRILANTAVAMAAGTLPFEVWTSQDARAATARVRHDAASLDGQKMLAIYARGVKAMNLRKPEDPRSWTFQWYTHWVGGAQTSGPKLAEIKRIFKKPNDPHRALAQEIWDTCQSHGPNEPEDNFLPWHRMFLLYFESIVRDAAGDDSFTLPYWNYTNSQHRAIPMQFQKPRDPLFSPLYIGKRNAGVNSNQPIDKGQPGNPLNTLALQEKTYSPTSNAVRGFNETLDFGLHGSIHVLVGNTLNMGTIPWSANDPIFWLHHCNIDRLWASWNNGGGKNPTGPWLDRQFNFADAKGVRIVGTVKDFVDTAPLGYSYDHLEPVVIAPLVAAISGLEQKDQLVASAGDPVNGGALKLGAAPVRVELSVAASALGENLLPSESGNDQRLYLVLSQLETHAQPGVLYAVYLGLPEGASAIDAEAHLVGSINFFHAGTHGTDGEHGPEQHDRRLSFEITDKAKALQILGSPQARPSVTIIPAGQPLANAMPVIGHIEIIRR